MCLSAGVLALQFTDHLLRAFPPLFAHNMLETSIIRKTTLIVFTGTKSCTNQPCLAMLATWLDVWETLSVGPPLCSKLIFFFREMSQQH